MNGDAVHDALAAASRRRVLQVLRDAGGPLDVPAVALGAGLHPSTVRFHLDILRRAGMVTEARQRAGARGRPRNVYVAVAQPGGGGYRLIASVLADHLARVGADGEQAGHDWVTAVDAAAGAPTDVDEAIERATARFVEMGFAPEPETFGGRSAGADPREADPARILLRACPFRDLAYAHPDVVCAMHLGVLRATVGDTFQARLIPFVEPELCVAEVADRSTVDETGQLPG